MGDLVSLREPPWGLLILGSSSLLALLPDFRRKTLLPLPTHCQGQATVGGDFYNHKPMEILFFFN